MPIVYIHTTATPHNKAGFPVVNRHFGKKLREKENERHEQILYQIRSSDNSHTLDNELRPVYLAKTLDLKRFLRLREAERLKQEDNLGLLKRLSSIHTRRSQAPPPPAEFQHPNRTRRKIASLRIHHENLGLAKRILSAKSSVEANTNWRRHSASHSVYLHRLTQNPRLGNSQSYVPESIHTKYTPTPTPNSLSADLRVARQYLEQQNARADTHHHAHEHARFAPTSGNPNAATGDGDDLEDEKQLLSSYNYSFPASPHPRAARPRQPTATARPATVSGAAGTTQHISLHQLIHRGLGATIGPGAGAGTGGSSTGRRHRTRDASGRRGLRSAEAGSGSLSARTAAAGSGDAAAAAGGEAGDNDSLYSLSSDDEEVKGGGGRSHHSHPHAHHHPRHATAAGSATAAAGDFDADFDTELTRGGGGGGGGADGDSGDEEWHKTIFVHPTGNATASANANATTAAAAAADASPLHHTISHGMANAPLPLPSVAIPIVAAPQHQSQSQANGAAVIPAGLNDYKQSSPAGGRPPRPPNRPSPPQQPQRPPQPPIQLRTNYLPPQQFSYFGPTAAHAPTSGGPLVPRPPQRQSTKRSGRTHRTTH